MHMQQFYMSQETSWKSDLYSKFAFVWTNGTWLALFTIQGRTDNFIDTSLNFIDVSPKVHFT